MRYAFVFILLIYLLIVQQALAIEDISVYEKGGIIYLDDLEAHKKIELVHGHSPLLSHDKSKFVYFPFFREELIQNASKTYNLYKIITRVDKILFEDDNEDPFGYQQWSPNDRYIVFDNGTDIIRGKTVFDTTIDEFIVYFLTHSERYGWLNNNEIVFSDVDHDYSISVINLQTKQIRILIKGDQKIRYLFENISSNKINFIAFAPQDKDVTLYSSDIDGKNVVKIKNINNYWNKPKQ